MKKLLTIAGFDPTNGAGIGNDIKILSGKGTYPLSIITAITAQNTKKVEDVYPVSKEILRSQLSTLLSDISIDGIKIGMLTTQDIAMIIWGEIRKFDIPIVFDPVMKSTGGDSLFFEENYKAYIDFIIPASTIVTPNVPEAQALSGIVIKDRDDMSRAAHKLLDTGVKGVLIKGGHLENSEGDLFVDENTEEFLYNDEIFESEIHGTGCSLAILILYYLAEKNSMLDSIRLARNDLKTGIKNSFSLGHGSIILDINRDGNE